MSPQPEVVLDVQKYIGTCLISQKPRNRKPGGRNMKGRAPSSSGTDRYRRNASPSSVHRHGYSRCECCGQFRYGLGQTGPASLVNLHWAGYPLFNLVGFGKKSTGKCAVGYEAAGSKGERLGPDCAGVPESHVRLSELAIRAHGVPLILNRKGIHHARGKGCPPPGEPSASRSKTLNRAFIREFEEGLALSENGSLAWNEGFRDYERQVAGCSPEAATEPGEGHFPRVLKPRKRRKRERRISPPTEEGDSSPNLNDTKALITLEPYRPLCYRFEERKVCCTDGASVADVSAAQCSCLSCCCSRQPSPPLSPTTSSSTLSSSPVSSGFLSSVPSQSVSPFPTPPPSPVGPKYSTEEPTWAPGPNENNVRCLELKWKTVYGEGNKASPRNKSSNFTIKGSSESEPKRNVWPVAPFTSTQPPARPWISMQNPTRNHPVCTFTVMCYNVLCDKYATRQMYGYCPNWALSWEYRRKGIMDEIRHYMSDIISLQEVETEQFYNMFLPELKKDGYEGIFSPKSRAKTMGENERKYVDGCAIFFRASKFRLIKEHLVEFTQLAMANAEGSDDMLNRVMTKDNIGLAAVLETREGAWENSVLPPDPSQIHQPLLVCTAHIHWDPEYCDVKLIQTMMLMHELRAIVEESSRSFRPRSHKPSCNAVPLLLCGDFNSLPDSGVVEFLTSGRISSSHPDLKELGYKACLQKLNTSERPNEYTHSFKLERAYKDDNMPFTNYTFDFKGIIDYILHSETLKPTGLLGPLDAEWMRIHKVVGCPHPHVPSDHLPLLVEYELASPQFNLQSNGVVVQR